MNMPTQTEWTKVRSRRNRKTKFHPTKLWWNGFDSTGSERWYLELSDGRILTPQHEDYFKWCKKISI